jgi:hypothetical protein
VLGELDGLLPWHHMAPYIAQSALAASMFGPRYAATHRGALIIQGMNHFQASNNRDRTDPGGVPEVRRGLVPYTQAVRAQGRAVAAFLQVGGAHPPWLCCAVLCCVQQRSMRTRRAPSQPLPAAANIAPFGVGCPAQARVAAQPEVAAAAAMTLVGLARDSAALAAPYMVMAGWGNVSAAWAADDGDDGDDGLAVGAIGAVGAAAGSFPALADELRVANSSTSRAVPAAMLDRARRFSAAVQLQLAAGLGAATAARLKVGAAPP